VFLNVGCTIIYRNSYVNLAHNSLIQNDPVVPDLIYAEKWSIWDRFKIDQGKDIQLKEFLSVMKDKFNLQIQMLMYGSIPIYGMGNDDDKKLVYPVGKLVSVISGEKFPQNKKYIELFIMAFFENKLYLFPT